WGNSCTPESFHNGRQAPTSFPLLTVNPTQRPKETNQKRKTDEENQSSLLRSFIAGGTIDDAGVWFQSHGCAPHHTRSGGEHDRRLRVRPGRKWNEEPGYGARSLPAPGAWNRSKQV